jgi:hypothetical protein
VVAELAVVALVVVMGVEEGTCWTSASGQRT